MSTTDNDNPCAEIDPTAGIDYGNRARNQLMEEYPWLWEKSVEFDFAERLGGCTDPPLKEIDHAMFELWTARRNAMSIADSHRFGRMTMSKTDRDAAIRPPGSDCQESIAAKRQESGDLRLAAQRRAAGLAEHVASRPDPPFTYPRPMPLEVGMDTNSDIEEAAFFDLLAAREAAIQGATGALAMLNVPTERLHFVARSTDNIISLAARIILYQRGESTDEPLEKIPRV